ncbi:g2293 [Coccomyxa elongata]
MRERVINVVTSLPFLVVGMHTRRARQTPEGKRFGSCLVAVGASATAYHAASGQLRCALRKLDYWTIALASTQMARALFPPASARLRVLNAASWALTPFQPTAVSTVNFGIAEVAFAREAMADKALRRDFRKHALIGGVGLGCFMLEDLAISRGHSFVHSLWHLHSCYAVTSANALMQSRERAKLDPKPELLNGAQFAAA